METFDNKYSTWYLQFSYWQAQLYTKLEKFALNFNDNLKGREIRPNIMKHLRFVNMADNPRKMRSEALNL